jgi:NADH-quinone oxidoreductase subunit M
MIYERRHTREISAFGGITKVMPLFAVAFMIVTLSSVALPGTNGFIGEFLILLGSWKTSIGLTAISTLGVIFGAVYMLWMFQRVMFGPIKNPENEKLTDLNLREIVVLVPLILMIFVMGVCPNAVFGKLTPSIDRMLTRTTGHMPVQGTGFASSVPTALHSLLGSN